MAARTTSFDTSGALSGPVHADQAQVELGERSGVIRSAVPLEHAKPGRQAVDLRAFGELALDHVARQTHPSERVARQFDGLVVAGDAHHLIGRQVAAGQEHRHGFDPRGYRSPARTSIASRFPGGASGQTHSGRTSTTGCTRG